MRLNACATQLALAALLAATTAAPRAAAAPKPAPAARPASVNPARPAPVGDPVAGRAKAEAERCVECHGPQGQGDGHTNPEVRFAKLAGQHADYLARQLRDYRSGARRHDVMRINAQRLEEADIRDLAAFFAAQPPMQGDGGGEHTTAALLYRQGDTGRGIVACAACHGDEGRAPLTAPRLAGQDARYLAQQLTDWRSGWRTEATPGAMNAATRALTDAEIHALSSYLASRR